MEAFSAPCRTSAKPLKRRRQRARIFVACEGDSEAAFCAWLQEICDDNSLYVHLDRPTRLKRGDPLTLVESAISNRLRSRQKAGVGHEASAILIDTDRLDDRSPRSAQAIALAKRERLTLIRQRPCFESVLLRLHNGYENTFPVTNAEAERQLRRVWQTYSKPPKRDQLQSRFQVEDLRRAATFDEDMRRLLTIIGLI